RKRKSEQNQRQVFTNDKDYRLRLQEYMYDSEYILAKVFRKDGPPLGDQFDALPSNAAVVNLLICSFLLDCSTSQLKKKPVCVKRSKVVSMHAVVDYEACITSSSSMRYGPGKGPITANGSTLKKHGMGKGLILQRDTLWKNHGVGKGPMTLKGDRGVRHRIGKGLMTLKAMRDNSTIRKKKKLTRESVVKKLAKKELAKRNVSLRNKKMKGRHVEKQNLLRKDKCKLGIDDVKRIENNEQFAKLLDDEELELRESQLGARILSCCPHFPISASHGCPLCKDLLAKFPPISVVMKQPLPMQPWASSPQLVTKFFRAFHFLCTYAVTLRIRSFTLDDFAQAFCDKNSLLLGQVHLSLLRLLLIEVEKELRRGFFSNAIKNCKFLNLLHSLDQCDFDLEFWTKSLNHLTWCEILRQVFVKAGFGSKADVRHKPNCNEEVNIIDKHALIPGTLKAELFCALLNHGKTGMDVTDLAKCPSIQQLNLTDALPELEDLISSALSSDVTLFEKISLSTYRVRNCAVEKESEDDFLSGSDDFESGDDFSEVTGGNDANDPEHDSGGGSSPCNEIDESHNGEVWLLGLMEGEYADLRVEDKLDALVNLLDLLNACSCIRMEDQLASNDECRPGVPRGSGAKVKRSSTAKRGNTVRVLSGRSAGNSPDIMSIPGQPVDSFVAMSKFGDEEKRAMMKTMEDVDDECITHPMQSIYLGSDRRYNRYWLFLGPCDGFDPGHRRIYFESSENGHWEIIDSEEAMSVLVSVLDRRGAREARLLSSLENIRETLVPAMSDHFSNRKQQRMIIHHRPDDSSEELSSSSSSSPVSDVDNMSSPSSSLVARVHGIGEKDVGRKRILRGGFRAPDASTWESFYHELTAVKDGKKDLLLRRCDHCFDLYMRDEKHCRICHTTFELDFDHDERYAAHRAVCRAGGFDTERRSAVRKNLSGRLQALKAAVYAIEMAVPEDALMGSWKRSSHNLWAGRLRRVSNLKEFRQVVADFVASLDEKWFYGNKYFDSDEIISSFSAAPQTCSAAALWLVRLDMALS
ncbi:hypothetical protein M569_00592, partial [Genlisea aurea]